MFCIWEVGDEYTNTKFCSQDDIIWSDFTWPFISSCHLASTDRSVSLWSLDLSPSLTSPGMLSEITKTPCTPPLLDPFHVSWLMDTSWFAWHVHVCLYSSQDSRSRHQRQLFIFPFFKTKNWDVCSPHCGLATGAGSIYSAPSLSIASRKLITAPSHPLIDNSVFRLFISSCSSLPTSHSSFL